VDFRSFIVTIVISLSAVACGELSSGAGQISQRIGEAASDPSVKEVDLGKLTTFGWDRVYFFKPGTPRKEVCVFIAARDGLCERVIRHQSVAGESMTIVFALKNQLTHVELHSLSNGRFDVTPTEAGMPREASVFKVRREPSTDGKAILWLEPK
jgi:hypothetical protein